MIARNPDFDRAERVERALSKVEARSSRLIRLLVLEAPRALLEAEVRLLTEGVLEVVEARGLERPARLSRCLEILSGIEPAS